MDILIYPKCIPAVLTRETGMYAFVTLSHGPDRSLIVSVGR